MGPIGTFEDWSIPLHDNWGFELLCHGVVSENLLAAGDEFPLSLSPEPDRDVPDEPRDEARSLPAIHSDVVFELGGEEFAWTGSLARIDGSGLDRESRTVPCRVVVERPTRDTSRSGGPQTLMRGMFVSCRIHTRPRRQMLTVPEIGIRPGNEVWLMRDGQLHVEPIRIVRVSSGVAVIDGLSAAVRAGDHLITTPVPDAREGLPVMETGAQPKPSNDKAMAKGGPA